MNKPARSRRNAKPTLRDLTSGLQIVLPLCRRRPAIAVREDVPNRVWLLFLRRELFRPLDARIRVRARPGAAADRKSVV